MNLEGATPHEITRFGSLVELDDPTALPLGVSPFLRNCKFHLTSVRTRDGIQSQFGFVLPSKQPVTGLAASVIDNPSLQALLAFDSAGNVYAESPAGTTKPVAVKSTQVTPPANASMQAAAAYKRLFLAFTDLLHAQGAPAVYDIATGILDPLSMKPVGAPWVAATAYQVGEVITPATPAGGNGHAYVCSHAGTTGAVQPAFPVADAGTVADNTVTWKEMTPVMAQYLAEPAAPTVNRVAGGGTFAGARDVYILVTLVNGQGETDGQIALAFKFVNTTANDQFVVTSPAVLSWMAGLVAPYAVTGYNVYEADVATGGGAPALAAYKKVNGGAVAIGASTNVNTTGGGAAPPAANSASIVPVGNICSGQRYAVILYVNRNGYISGMSQPIAFGLNVAANGGQVFVGNIWAGPANTAARIVAFTPAGGISDVQGGGITTAGPYFWISPAFPNGIFNLSAVAAGITVAAIVNGVTELATLVNDNVTTSGYFNFDDNYLKLTLQDVSANFRLIQVPNCSDIYYSPTLRRLFYSVDTLPSGWYVSNQDSPESVYGDTGIVQCAENDGELRVAVREYGQVVYLLKQRSGHVLAPSPTDPSQWDVKRLWKGSGPCGPRAVDVCTTFLCYVHRSGVYVFMSGTPLCISEELNGLGAPSTALASTWKRINWSAAQTIWVQVDDESRELRVGVPLDGSTSPSHVLTCNYEESPTFSKPIHFSMFAGKEIATGDARRWSVDDIPANLCIRAERALQGPPPWMDQATAQSQLLFASPNPDGAVSALIPRVFNDNAAGIDWVYETACPQDMLRPNRLRGVQANVDGGGGEIIVEVLALRGKDPQQGGVNTKGVVIPLAKRLIPGVPYACGVIANNERFRLRFSNGKKPDVWGDIKYANLWSTPITRARPG